MARAWERAGFSGDASNGRGFFQADPDLLNVVTGDDNLLSDRRSRSDIKADLEFLADISAQGILQPIIACKDPEALTMDVVVGRRRVLAAKALNDPEALEAHLMSLDAEIQESPAVGYLQEWCEEFQDRARGLLVPVIVRATLTDAEKLRMVISENEHRKSDSEINKALKMKRLLDVTEDKSFVAVTFGFKSGLSVDQQISLLQLSQNVQNAIEDGKVAKHRALKWLRLAHSEQDSKLQEYLEARAGNGGRNLRATNGHKPPTKKKLVAFRASSAMDERCQADDEDERLWTSEEVQALVGWISGEVSTEEARERCETIGFFLDEAAEAATLARSQGRGSARRARPAAEATVEDPTAAPEPVIIAS